MKIGFDAKRAFTNAVGLGNFSRNSISALAGMFRNDRFYLFHPGNSNPLFAVPENAIEIRPKNPGWKMFKNLWRSFQISKLAKQNNLDLFHGLSHELPVGIEKTGIKSVVTMHDLIFIRYPEYFQKIDRNIYDFKFRHACKIANSVHAISEQTKQDLMTYFSVPENKISVIYQSVNPVFFEKADDDQIKNLRKKYKLPEQFILTVGTIEPRKNLMNLLKGMASKGIKVPLVVVGKPTNYLLKVKSYIQEDKHIPEVIFLNGITDLELSIIYRLAEIMVYPSVFEGFGLPVAEAQASGCPVITSNTSSMPEAGGDAAKYINPEVPGEIGEALLKLLEDKTLREIMVIQGKINAQRFTPANFATKMNQLYHTVLNE